VNRLDVEQAAGQYFARIHRAALVLSGNPWDADDLVQETFLVLARRPEQFAGRSSLYTWLYGILLNLERRSRRRQGIHNRKLRVLWGNEPSEERSHPPAEAPVEAAEWKRSLWSQVARLPDGQRQALVLRFSEGLRYDEIAHIMQCPLGTVKSRIFHGLAGLKQLLEVQGEELCRLPDHPDEDIHHAV
jgi:RNA polymerase sigma-70 factor (ECF subfamily)